MWHLSAHIIFPDEHEVIEDPLSTEDRLTDQCLPLSTSDDLDEESAVSFQNSPIHIKVSIKAYINLYRQNVLRSWSNRSGKTD